ncbi:MAG TPA: hypothetical protein VM285_12105, partial [Polyangia bacterium]|nr:hypothetical protein [Polyangia bacterium]
LLAALAFSGTAAAQRAGSTSRGGESSFRLESDGGGVLPTYWHRGYAYVEGQRGQRYAIRVFNHSAERIEAVVTVDGRDVITGQPGNYRRNRGYVIQPYGSVRIDGFRTSWSGVAAFRFTDVPDSYAARMGDASNVGVVGVAVFKEKRQWRPEPPPYPIATDDYDGERRKLGSGYGGGGRSGAPAAEAAPSGDYPASPRSHSIGTGYGESAWSPASQTTFERRSRGPEARLALYYDDREGLVARGVIPRPWYPPPRPVQPRPFPESPDHGFAPPPPPGPFYWE